MSEQQEDTRFCPNCGQEVGAEDRFCNNCGHNLSVPPSGEGRIETPSVNVPPPPASARPAQEGLGGFLRSFGLGAGACVGMAAALVVLLVIAVGGCALLLAGADSSSRGAGEALETAPDLQNAASLKEAERIAARSGDFEVVEGTRQDSREPEGAIISQTPDPGEQVEEGSRIYVIVSKRQVAEVPDVSYQASGDATQALEEAGFEVEEEAGESSESYAGYVIDQDPRGGRNAEVGSPVTITVGV